MTPGKLRELARLVEARKARDLAQLERLMVEDRELAAEIAALARLPETDAASGDLPLRQQAKRQAWADWRQIAAAHRRSELGPEIAAARAQAAESLGKHRALELLEEKAERVEKQVKAARIEREAMPDAPRATLVDRG